MSVDTGGGDPNGDSTLAAICADGRYVAFIRFASDLVPGDTNGSGDVFVRDLQDRHHHAGERRHGGAAIPNGASDSAGDHRRRPLRRVRVGRE